MIIGRLYDGELELLQVFRGHTESIQAILHIPELDQVNKNKEKLFFNNLLSN